MDSIHTFLANEDGEDLIEYGVLAAFISIAAILVIRMFGPPINALYSQIVPALTP